jgi:hypothetical protein
MSLARLGWRAPVAALLLGFASPGALGAEEPASVEEEAPLEGEAKKQHAQDVSKFDKRYKAIKNRDELLQMLNELESTGSRAARDWLMDYAKVVKSAEYRLRAFEALTRIGTAKGISFLCGKYGVRAADSIVQNQAVEALGKAPDRRAVAALLDALGDGAVKMETRGAICLTLGKTAPDDAKVQETLYRQLEDRRDTIRAKAIEALGYVKDDRSFTLLLDTLTKDKNPLLREGAAKGLKHAGRQEAVAALKAAVANESAQPVRGAAIDTLKALGATAD